MPEIVLIAALAERDRLIGDGMDLPWRIPADLARFKRLTSGHPIIMGRTTFESLLHQMGRPLPGRKHLVLTSNPQRFHREHAEYTGQVQAYGTPEEALEAAHWARRVFIGGGASVYEAFLERADRWELTLVAGTHTGDTYFPPYEHLLGEAFAITSEEAHPEARPAFRFVTAERCE